MIIRPEAYTMNRPTHAPLSFLQYRNVYGSGTYGGSKHFGSVFGASCPAGTTLNGDKCCVPQAQWDGLSKRCVLLSANPVVITSPSGKKHVKAQGGTPPPPDGGGGPSTSPPLPPSEEGGGDTAPPPPPTSTGGGGGGGSVGGGGGYYSDSGGGSSLSDLPWLPIAIGIGIVAIAVFAMKGKGGAAGGGGGTTVIAA